MDNLMTVQEVKDRLHCSPAHVYALIDAGELRCYRIGLGKQGGVRVSEEQLQEYLKKKEHGQPTGDFKHIKI